MSPSRSALASVARLSASVAGRVVLLVLLVVGAGVAAGFAVGYPLRQLDLGGPGPKSIDQFALVGEFDPSDALVATEDLPDDWSLADPSVSSAVQLVGAEYCGQSASVEGQLGEPLKRAYVDSQNGRFLLSEVVRVRRQSDAGAYVNEVARVLSGCRNQRFFADEGGRRVETEIRDDRRNPPMTDYVTRTLVPVKGGTTRILTYFQVGDVIVAIQYAGPPNPPRDLMDRVERAVLARTDPKDFSPTANVAGNRPLPAVEDPTTTTVAVADPAQPSPTSSPEPPPTAAPNPTFETPRSTTTARSRSTTTAPR